MSPDSNIESHAETPTAMADDVVTEEEESNELINIGSSIRQHTYLLCESFIVSCY